jgi:hypothetical protein
VSLQANIPATILGTYPRGFFALGQVSFVLTIFRKQEYAAEMVNTPVKCVFLRIFPIW